ncbi:hypothetical protein GPECTOR_38g355 [Gonium pectorale]|uniref:Uncharacterized protein n=1 Tax=Gonium pectorale TaxID=33097 RepID=A0A150GB87_GONPE|nr:hypothetical protein GPECTOR_38g355 [Gonium pectorale]|eukprot:KXZ47117.1 hypothetical protein GPECTOR_38g355 [Gonium pectorale]
MNYPAFPVCRTRHAPPSFTGQQLTLTALSLFLTEVGQPLGPAWSLSLSGLAPAAFISVPKGATLELRNVTLVLSRSDLTSLFTGLCRDTGAWPHSPGVTMDDGTIAIRELDTTAPGPDGMLGGGGAVRWRDVLITCNDPGALDRPVRPGLWKPYPCAALAVGGSGDGGAFELRRASAELMDSANGPVFLSITANISLASGFGYWNVLTQGSAGRLVLRGSPGDATTLDLAGREDAWVWAPPPSSPDPTYAYLYDMMLVNLPYSTHPAGPADLMTLAVLSFGVRPSTGSVTGPRLRLARCTLVLPDEEVAFLRGRAEAAGAGPSSALAWVNLSDVVLNLSIKVLLLNCTLLSASAYAALPGAVLLLPQSRVWPPLLLHGNRTRALAQGPSGLAVAPGLEAALAVQEHVCGQEPGGAAATCVARRHDDTVSPAGQDPEGSIMVGRGEDAAGPGAGLGSPGSLAAGDMCTVSGYAPELLGGRTFTDLKGVAGRCMLARPLRLRNLVLYNLAPGGSGPPLEGGDAAWANSSLPLWYFSLPRSASPGDPAPLLLLDNVTLVVPEPEWRALAAAVLMRHAPQALPLSLDPGSGVLVLASVRHYGWYGTHVTITYTLPPDAPPGPSLLPYPELRLPYQELADVNVGLNFSFTPVVTRGGMQRPGPDVSISDDAPAQPRYPDQPLVGFNPAASPAPIEAPQQRPSGPPSWVVPLAVALPLTLGLTMLLAAAVAVAAWRRRRALQRQRSGDVAEAGRDYASPPDPCQSGVVCPYPAGAELNCSQGGAGCRPQTVQGGVPCANGGSCNDGDCGAGDKCASMCGPAMETSMTDMMSTAVVTGSSNCITLTFTLDSRATASASLPPRASKAAQVGARVSTGTLVG